MEVIEQIYKLRRNFVIIGLTGRTGSGCSMLTDWMRKERKLYCADLLNLIPKKQEPFDNVQRKYIVVDSFLRENWTPFFVIKASDVIVYYALLLDTYSAFQTAVTRVGMIEKSGSEAETGIVESLSTLQKDFLRLHKLAKKCDIILESDTKQPKSQLQKCINLLLNEVSLFRDKLRSILKDKYIATFQQWGNNIRKYNSVLDTSESQHSPACLARKIKQFIKAQHRINKEEDMPTYVVIDALRNPYEILYFRERYTSFYVMSMNTTDEVRRINLKLKGYTDSLIEAIDKQEKEKKEIEQRFSEQDIDKCIELSDIHLAWEKSFEQERMGQELPFDDIKYLTEGQVDLLKQLSTYIALIMHPGLVPPTPHERAMQVAYTAKLNSGCLSRQVGAVVTNTDFSVKSIGWNTVPQGQTPCSLRCLLDLCGEKDTIAYSEYERKDPFSAVTERLIKAYSENEAENKLNGLRIPYCFKDVHTSSDEEQSHNQVHTRSLHAEENAFLQLAKYGSIGIAGGYLYTTASCCELCAKKAYQLGIKRIFYVDAYPGITKEHILASGNPNYRPEMTLFRGAVGRAYINLFNPYVPLKDEIKVRTGVNVKAISQPEKSDKA
jgi:deoxycytidylate deaminase